MDACVAAVEFAAAVESEGDGAARLGEVDAVGYGRVEVGDVEGGGLDEEGRGGGGPEGTQVGGGEGYDDVGSGGADARARVGGVDGGKGDVDGGGGEGGAERFGNDEVARCRVGIVSCATVASSIVGLRCVVRSLSVLWPVDQTDFSTCNGTGVTAERAAWSQHR